MDGMSICNKLIYNQVNPTWREKFNIKFITHKKLNIVEQKVMYFTICIETSAWYIESKGGGLTLVVF